MLETSLLSSSALLETLLDVSLTGVILFEPVYDTDGSSIIDLAYRYLNPAAQRMLELPEQPAHTFLTLYPHAVDMGIFAFYQDTFLSGEAARYDVNYSYDGLDNYFHLAAKPSGDVLVVSFTDTADQDRSAAEASLRQSRAREQAHREKAEAQQRELAIALRQTEEQHQQLFVQQNFLERVLGQVPASIATLSGPQHRYSYYNSNYHVLSGERTRLGLTVAEVYPELLEQGFIRLLDQVYETGSPFIGTETSAMLFNPSTRQTEQHYIDFIYQPLLNEVGQIQGILAFVVEVTEKVRARQQVEQLNRELAATQELAALNQELQAANEKILSTNEELAESNERLSRTNAELEQVNRDLDTFIYTASHDLKVPISNIEGLLNTLLCTLPAEILASERVERTTALMGQSVERFKKTIANLTEVVKLQKENSREAVLVDLSEVVREVSLDLEPLIRTAQAQVMVDLAVCSAIRFSEKNLRSVVYNLLSNALKYRSPERVPLIGIHCQSTPTHHVLTVSDNGLGMEASRLPQLFTMFKRFHNHVEGTGIGLYMIRKMVENAGGRIEVESQVSVGATFRVYFIR